MSLKQSGETESVIYYLENHDKTLYVDIRIPGMADDREFQFNARTPAILMARGRTVRYLGMFILPRRKTICFISTGYHMKTTLSILLLIMLSPAHGGDIKRWIDIDGTLTFGDAPPPKATGIEIVTYPAHDTGIETGDYYAPRNQLYRLQSERKRKASRRRVAALEDERLRQQGQDQRRTESRQRAVRAQKCKHARARLREYEHRSIQTYRNEADRLRDESQLARLRKLETEHCD